MKSSDKLDEIAPALVASLRKLRNPKADTKGQVRGRADYMYLGLPGLSEHVRDAWRETGLAFTQEVEGIDGGIQVRTRIFHLSGQWIELGPTFIPVDGTAQDYGSAITYARRYSLAAAVGLAAEEDDDASRLQRKNVGTAGARGDRGRHQTAQPSPATSEPSSSSGSGSEGAGPSDEAEVSDVVGQVVSSLSAPASGTKACMHLKGTETKQTASGHPVEVCVECGRKVA